jgi:hypothetical protein
MTQSKSKVASFQGGGSTILLVISNISVGVLVIYICMFRLAVQESRCIE